MLRMGFQQFPYQQPVFGDLARMRVMFDRVFPAHRYKVLATDVVTDLLGAGVGAYCDLAPFFMAGVMRNHGRYDPGWLKLPNSGALPPEDISRVFERMSASPKDIRLLARSGRNQDPRLRQYDYNPLVATPFVRLSDGTGLAPQPLFFVAKFSPAAMFYAGIESYGNDLAKDLGVVNEVYVLVQLGQLTSVGADVNGEVEYAKDKLSVDCTVVMADLVMLVEVKSARPAFAALVDTDSYVKSLGRTVGHAIDQLNTTYEQWQAGNPALAHLPRDGRSVCGYVVVPEPLYKVNEAAIRLHFPSPPFDVAIVSMTELEDLVGWTLYERCSTVIRRATQPSGQGAVTADVRRALREGCIVSRGSSRGIRCSTTRMRRCGGRVSGLLASGT